MGKNFPIKTSMGKPPNEMGNCPFASPLVAPLHAVNSIDDWKKIDVTFFSGIVIINVDV
jgi:hypothetical protein